MRIPCLISLRTDPGNRYQFKYQKRIKWFGYYLTFLFLFPYCFNCTLLSQNFQLETQIYNEDNGLSRYANAIHQDKRGIIWLGTQYGLYRFDGQEFTHFDGNVGLPFRQVMEIYEDSEGWFWLFKSCRNKGPNCKKDLAFFNPISQSVLTFEERFGSKVSMKSHEIVHIARDSNQFYITGNKKLLLWSFQKGIREKNISGFEHTPLIFAKISENMFGAVHSNIFHANAAFKHQYITIDTTGLVNTFSEPIIFNNQKVGNLTKLNQHTIEFEKLRIGSSEYSFAADGKIEITPLPFDMPLDLGTYLPFQLSEPLLASETGDFFHPKYEKEVKFDDFIHPSFHKTVNRKVWKEAPIRNVWIKTKNPENPAYPYQNLNLGYRGYLFDKFTQTSWLASRPGVESSHFEPNYFTHIANPFSNIQLAGGIGIFSDSLAMLGIQNTSFFYSQKANEEPSFTKLDLGSTMPSRIIIPDGDNYWLFSRNYIFQLNKHQILARYPSDDLIGLGNGMWVDGKIWISAHEKILKFDPKTEKFSSFSKLKNFEKAKSEGFKWMLKIDENHLWILTNSSLYLCSIQKGIIEELRINNAEEPIQFNQISDAKSNLSLPTLNTQTKPGKIYWLSSMKGLIRLTIDSTNLKALDIQHFNTNNGLPTNEILAAFEDDYGFVWMPSPHGLIQLQPESGLSRLYTKADGLSNSGFQNNTFAEAPNGTLYFGGYEGFNIFHPKDFRDVDLSPEIPLIILDFEQHSDNSGKIEYRLEDILKKGEIVLAPGDKLFNIRVALKDYRHAEDHRFAYKIEGFQEEWSEDKSSLIRISGLPYGAFTLKIKGRLHNGLYSQSELIIPIHVLKPFYLQSWFLIAMGSLLLLGIYFFNFWRTKQLKVRQKQLEKSIAEATETILQDKTIIESQAEELRKLDKLKSRFFANVSHELRTPLTLVLGPIEAALKRKQLKERDQDSLLTAQRNGKRLNTLINEILDLTKLDAGKLQLEPSIVHWYSFLRSVVANFNPLASQNNINYQLIYEGNEMIQVNLDKGKVETVLLNLLSNAFKFTEAGGTISVKAINKAQFLKLEIQDSGRGIPEFDLPHVFDRFYQAKNQDGTAEGGTGIGLALSKEYILLMDGSIRVESEAGKGSTFFVEIPRIEILGQLPNEEISNLQHIGSNSSEVSQTPLEKNGIKPQTAENQSQILVVEDNPDLQQYIQSLLEPKYEVIVVGNGLEALGWLAQPPAPLKGESPPTIDSPFSTPHLREAVPPLGGQGVAKAKTSQPHNPNLIISDIMMPKMDGYQLLEKIKSDELLRYIPVIMLSARAGMDDKLKALRIGVDDYITKPFEQEELLVRVANLLENSKNRQLAKQETTEIELGETTKKPEPLILNEDEQEWLDKVENTVKNNLEKINYTVDDLALDLQISKRQFYRQLKQLIGQTPNQYIKTIRLNTAREWLQSGKYDSVKAIAFSVGFKDVVYFSRQFKQEFGRLPSEYGFVE